MAKDRRYGRDRDDKGRRPRKPISNDPPMAKPVQPVKPPMAKPVQPVKPPAAQPVKPPAAKPVQPTRPPAAQPVKPVKPAVAKPVKPAAAQPVKPAAAQPVRPAAAQPVRPAAAQPVRPAAAQPVKPAATQASSRRSSRMAEEDVGYAGRGGRRGGRVAAPGMSNALKTALVTAGIALAVLAIAVLAGGPKKGDPEKQLNNAGLKAAQDLARLPENFWVGGAAKASRGEKPTSQAKRIVVDLFGEAGEDFWERHENEANQDFDLETMDQEEIEEIKEAKERWQEALAKWNKGESGGQAKSKTNPLAEKQLRQMVAVADAAAQPGNYRVLGAWVRKSTGMKGEGDMVASSLSPRHIRYNWSQQQGNHVDGKVNTFEARIFGASVSGSGGKLRAYVALWTGPLTGAGGGGSGVGLAMLILGPLLVGGLAFALANAHTKNVKDLAREVERLGSKGDPSRMLRAQGAEASAVARSVERMVANLEFRSQHGDEDLDEIVEREKKVADEIHGALISKNPPRLSDYEVETLFKPGFEIGGDHFEYFPIDEDHLGVILLDTNVRGVTAALVMASARAYVRAAAPGVLSPAEVLRSVNKDLAGELPPGRHVTALYVVLNTREGKATVASAGHLPLLVYRHAAGKVAKVNPEGIALGLDEGPLFDRSLQEGDIPVEIGDRIVLYTDGALRIQNEEGEEFGESRFYQVVTREAPKNSQAFVNFVGGAIDQFHLPTPQNDDVTISTVKRLK